MLCLDRGPEVSLSYLSEGPCAVYPLLPFITYADTCACVRAYVCACVCDCAVGCEEKGVEKYITRWRYIITNPNGNGVVTMTTSLSPVWPPNSSPTLRFGSLHENCMQGHLELLMSHLRLDTVSAAHGGRASQKPELIGSSLDKWGDKPKLICWSLKEEPLPISKRHQSGFIWRIRGCHEQY